MVGRTRKSGKLLYGWGVNDVNYPVHKSEVINGKSKKVWRCPYYVKWRSIIERCFCPIYQRARPTYLGCTVSEEWKYLSNFIRWVDSQPNRDWVNCVPDKDLIIEGNKHYSPSTVVFVTRGINGFLINRCNDRGDCMLGVNYTPYDNKKRPYTAKCNNPFTTKQGYLGTFSTELEAHKVWQAKKHDYACLLADLQDDSRVAEALRQRYAPDKDWTKV